MQRPLTAGLLLGVAAVLASCESDGPVTGHIRARVETDFNFTEVVWVDVVVSWGSTCTSEEWFIVTPPAPRNNLTDQIFVSLPATFDVLPEHPDGREMVTIFVAARDGLGVIATDWRTVAFEPGERVTTELSLRNPCAPAACEPNYESEDPPDNWCGLSVEALKAYRAEACECPGTGGF